MHQTTECKIHEQKLIELEGKIQKYTVKLGDFSTPLRVINRTTGQKIIKDIEKFNMKPTIGYSASKQTNWKKRLQDDIEDFKLGIINTFCFVTTNATFSSEFVQKQLNRLGKDTLLMIDEAHNFGSPNLALCLNPKIEYRLALSATLDRHGDPEGTAILYNYFGEKSIEYDLARAIAEDKLTPYYYYPVAVCLEDDEFEKYKNLSYEIAKECHKDKNGKIA